MVRVKDPREATNVPNLDQREGPTDRPTTAAVQLHRRCAETAQFRGYDGVMHYRLAVQPTLHGADRIAFR